MGGITCTDVNGNCYNIVISRPPQEVALSFADPRFLTGLKYYEPGLRQLHIEPGHHPVVINHDGSLTAYILDREISIFPPKESRAIFGK